MNRSRLGSLHHLIRAKALSAAGVLARKQGDYTQANILLQKSLELWESLGDLSGKAIALNNLAGNAAMQDDLQLSLTLCEESLALWRTMGDQKGLSLALNNLGNLRALLGNYEAAFILMQECETLCRATGNEDGAILARHNQGYIHLGRGHYEQAAEILEECLVAFERNGNQTMQAETLLSLGSVKREQREIRVAESYYRQGFSLHQKGGNIPGIIQCLEGIAGVRLDEGLTEKAAYLFGSATKRRARIGFPVMRSQKARYDQGIEQLHQALDEEQFDLVWMQGQEALIETLPDIGGS